MKTKSKIVVLTKDELKKLFRDATAFCKGDEYEQGERIRDNNASLGIDFFMTQTVNSGMQSTDKRIEINYDKLYTAIRVVIDESSPLYYNANGTLRKDKYKAAEANKIADKVFKKFMEGYSKS